MASMRLAVQMRCWTQLSETCSECEMQSSVQNWCPMRGQMLQHCFSWGRSLDICGSQGRLLSLLDRRFLHLTHRTVTRQ
eukprot:1813424-Rhodomonas_salina.1